MKKTKIVCTIGPASESPEVLEKLIESGMNVARLNFSHGDHDEHLTRIQRIREISEKLGQPVGIMLDTKGPEIRTHKMAEDVIYITKGDTVRVSMKEVLGTKEKFSVTYEHLIHDVEVGMQLLLDDGLIELQIKELDFDNDEIVTTALNTGVLKDNKGVNVPGASLNLPGLTEKDRSDILFGLENGINFIAASFVRRTSDVLEIKEILEVKDNDLVLIAADKNKILLVLHGAVQHLPAVFQPLSQEQLLIIPGGGDSNDQLICISFHGLLKQVILFWLFESVHLIADRNVAVQGILSVRVRCQGAYIK